MGARQEVTTYRGQSQPVELHTWKGKKQGERQNRDRKFEIDGIDIGGIKQSAEYRGVIVDLRGFKYALDKERLDINNSEAVEARMIEYVEDAIQRDAPVTQAGMAVWLGVSRKTLRERVHDPEFSFTIKNVVNWIEAHYSERLIAGKGSPVGVIFALKNDFGWIDKVDVEHSGKVNITTALDLFENRTGEVSTLEGEIVEEEPLDRLEGGLEELA